MSDEKTMTERESHGRKVVRAVETFFSEGIARLTQAKKILDQIGAEYQPEGDPMENALAHMSDLINDFLERADRLPGMIVKEESEDDEIISTPLDANDKRYAKELLDFLDGMRWVGPNSPQARKEILQRTPERRAVWDHLCAPLADVMEELLTACGETRNGEKIN